MIAVFFDEDAVTFDQAPFRLTATYHDPLSPVLDPCAFLLSVLQDNAQIDPSLLQSLEEYVNAMRQGSLDVLQTREQDVTNIRVDGEFLSTDFPFDEFSTIGTTPQANILTHGATDISGIQLHSIALLTAFMESQQTATNGQTLNEVTTKLTDLLGMIFDKSLFAASTDTDTRNFLEQLIQNQSIDGGLVTNFTTDMWQIAQDGGLTMANNDLTKALIAFDMQAYYDDRLAGTDTLFNYEGVTGGIHFDRANVAATYANDDVKGYQSFANYLSTLPEAERTSITQQLPDLTDWYIQAGDQAMTAIAGDQRAFMLGGSGEDHLTGGSQDDVLVGNGGNDYIEGGKGQDVHNGGAGDDLMIGGEGIDTYIIEGNDTIQDSGLNYIIYNGQVLAGAFLQDGTSSTYRSIGDDSITITFHSPGHLVLNGTDSITFANQTSAADFANGDFGITLRDQVDANYTLSGTEGNDSEVFPIDSGVAYYAFSGNISGPGVQYFMGDSTWPMFGYSGLTTPPNLLIDGAGGDDFLTGLAGSDTITGGSGNDRIIGDGFVHDPNPLYSPWGNTGAADILSGGAGRD